MSEKIKLTPKQKLECKKIQNNALEFAQKNMECLIKQLIKIKLNDRDNMIYLSALIFHFSHFLMQLPAIYKETIISQIEENLALIKMESMDNKGKNEDVSH